jgi:hypothetical protein
MRARRSSWFPAKVAVKPGLIIHLPSNVSFFLYWSLANLFRAIFGDGTETWQRARVFLGFISSRVGSLCFCGLVFRPFEG